MFEIANLNGQIYILPEIFILLLSIGGLFYGIWLIVFDIYFYSDFKDIIEKQGIVGCLKYRFLFYICLFFGFILIYIFALFTSAISEGAESKRLNTPYSTQYIYEKNEDLLFNNKDNNKMFSFYYKIGNSIKTQNVGKGQVRFYTIDENETPKAIWYKEYTGNFLFYYYKHTCDIYLPVDQIPYGYEYNLG